MAQGKGMEGPGRPGRPRAPFESNETFQTSQPARPGGADWRSSQRHVISSQWGAAGLSRAGLAGASGGRRGESSGDAAVSGERRWGCPAGAEEGGEGRFRCDAVPRPAVVTGVVRQGDTELGPRPSVAPARLQSFAADALLELRLLRGGGNVGTAPAAELPPSSVLLMAVGSTGADPSAGGGKVMPFGRGIP